jgi:hypothetical protein
MSLQFENNLLAPWVEGPHSDPHERGAETKSRRTTSHDQVIAVMQALQRQQSEIPIPAEPVSEVARGFRLSSPTRNARIESPGQRAFNDSLIKARYASTILRVARTSDRETAARLVRSISRDLPLHSELPEVADIHLRAIASFDQLATSLVDATNSKQQPLWKTALDAAAEWLRLVQPNGDNPAASRHAEMAITAGR